MNIKFFWRRFFKNCGKILNFFNVEFLLSYCSIYILRIWILKKIRKNFVCFWFGKKKRFKKKKLKEKLFSSYFRLIFICLRIYRRKNARFHWFACVTKSVRFELILYKVFNNWEMIIFLWRNLSAQKTIWKQHKRFYWKVLIS